jgi:two-component SAPR family response regulator
MWLYSLYIYIRKRVVDYVVDRVVDRNSSKTVERKSDSFDTYIVPCWAPTKVRKRLSTEISAVSLNPLGFLENSLLDLIGHLH